MTLSLVEIPVMLTYPARPMNGGRLEHATPKVGTWYAEPKANGWRALVHGPSRTIWNRHGEALSIGHEFPKALDELAAGPFEWYDCEALERRHGHGRGTLLVIDAPTLDLPYEERKRALMNTFCPLLGGCQRDTVYSVPAFTDAAAVYSSCKHDNKHTFAGAEFYEGIVMKKHGSRYPLQRLNAERETPDWIKHRWKF